MKFSFAAPTALTPLALTFALISNVCACSSNGEQQDSPEVVDSSVPDASSDTHTDSALPDVSPDNTNELEAGPEGGAADSSDAQEETDADVSCEGSCRKLTVNADFGGNKLHFDRAFYGLTPPEDGGPWTIHLEVQAGGSSSCPEESSPTPTATLVFGDLGLASDSPPPSVSLVDFSGTLLENSPVETATKVTIQGFVPNVCISCAQQQSSDPDGFVALDFDAEFPSGKASGHVFAIHCNSLDL